MRNRIVVRLAEQNDIAIRRGVQELIDGRFAPIAAIHCKVFRALRRQWRQPRRVPLCALYRFEQ